AAAEAAGQTVPLASAAVPYLKGLALKPAEPAPLHLLLRVYMRLEDEKSCADAFWLYWPKMSGNYPRVAGKRERDGEFGDGWAWDEWDGMKDRNAVAGIMECVATCFAGLQRAEEGWRAWKFAMELLPENQEFPLRYAANLNAAGYREESDIVLAKFVPELNRVWFEQEGGAQMPRIPRPTGKRGERASKVIVIYCHEYTNAWFPNWGPSSLGKGLGGSEEVVIYVSRELARLGYWVEVYADPVGDDVGVDNGGSDGGHTGNNGGGVVWYSCKSYNVANPPDVFVAWRYHVSLHLAKGSGRVFLWLQ
ncbi:unnamed protein product, partial [Sphacelaria rigidula]